MEEKYYKLAKEFVEKSKEILGEDLTQAIVFGSRTRNDYTENSDLDIALLVKIKREDIYKRELPIMDLRGEIFENQNIFISPIMINEKIFNKWVNMLPFYNNILNEGIKIYG